MARSFHPMQPVIGLICLLASTSCLFAAYTLSQETYALVKHGTRTEGTVTALIERTNAKNRGSVYAPVVRFTTTDGRVLSFDGAAGTNPPAYAVGERVKVIYPPNKPEDASIESFLQLWAGNVLVGFIGLVFLAAVVGRSVVVIRYWQLKKWLKQNGQRIATTYLAIEQNTRVRVNHNYGYQISTQGKNPFTGEIQYFLSEIVWTDPAPFLTGRTTIDVLVHPQNPKKYWMDLSFLPN